MDSPFAGRNVLVTGAGGSIGSELCRLIVSDGAESLKLLSLTEGALYNVERKLRHEYAKYRQTKLVPILGSVCDRRLLAEILPGVDLVVHAAAHKHVPICEANPLAAILNNVYGTYQLARAAAHAGVGEMCLISTDKAVRPTSIMGATKRLAELIFRDLAPFDSATNFFTVRFGNVMNSAGSVMPLWREQIERGGPLTLTDARCERFFMSIPDAVHLVAQACALHPCNGTFVLDMGKPERLLHVAEAMIRNARRKIEIVITGLRPGEKLTEELHFGGELVPTGVERVLRVSETPLVSLTEHELATLITRALERNAAAAVTLLWSIVCSAGGFENATDR